MKKTFTAYEVASIVYDVAEKNMNHDSWIAQRDVNFLTYLFNLGVLSEWERVHGKIAKKYRPKGYVEQE